MKSNHRLRRGNERGFALVVTLSMMILLTVIAVGLLSLSSISLRKNGAESASYVARANARMALMLALGELQLAAGPDQRITADRTLLDQAAGTDENRSNALGIWKGWSPKLAEPPNPPQTSFNYGLQKTNTQFVAWLTSSPEPLTPDSPLAAASWATGGTVPDPVQLFTLKSDGFYQAGSKVGIQEGTAAAGSMAWTIVQEGTKAKINVGGPEENDIEEKNDSLQAQARPYLDKSDTFKQPSKGWNERSGKVLSLAQAKLDNELYKGDAQIPENADFTTTSMGLLTDVVFGGLKTDLNLGFEMSESNFEALNWGDHLNPFTKGGIRNTNIVSGYLKQRPLFKVLNTGGLNPNLASTKATLKFDPASTSFTFPSAAVPTFTTLRSFYRTPYHMYKVGSEPTIFERPMDHIAVTKPVNTSAIPNPGEPPKGLTTQTAYRPILDRIIYVLSLGVDVATKKPALVYTPIITLWNPYNVGLEIEGAVACPWLDMPFTAVCNFSSSEKPEQGMSQAMGSQFLSVGHGRSIKPYFFAAITKNGSANISAPIHFKAGEVRVFAPANPTDIPFVPSNPAGSRTVYLKPVDNSNQLSTRGGLVVPMKDIRAMTAGDSLSMEFRPATADPYPFAVCLEDGGRLKNINSDTLRGAAIADVQTVNFATNNPSAATVVSPRTAYSTMVAPASRQPFAVIETYHRVAADSAQARRSDIVYTTNPRQSFINRYLSDGNFKAGPHYETVVRPVSKFADVIQTDQDGSLAFYGLNNSSNADSQLAFFEAPQQPIISLAALQHADLSGTAYSTANQFANSWASAYVPRNVASRVVPAGGGGSGGVTYTRDAMPAYDYSYLANEALWDSFFFSSLAPEIQMQSKANGTASVWNVGNANSAKVPLKNILSEFIDNPEEHPLRNTRMKFYAGKETLADLKNDLLEPEGCVKIAAHLQVDGAFNINSTSRKAWIATLSGMRDAEFDVNGGSAPTGKTAFPRFRYPMGSDSNRFNGFRSLSDNEIASLADKIILEVRNRGPFLSLGEFVNRRVDNSTMALKGALQAAIDATGINTGSLFDKFEISLYPPISSNNVTTPNTGVGVPGYLTQADVLQSLAPIITPRSDTFTIRAYGEAKDKNGKVLATARCEAVVQRMPEYCDEATPPDAISADVATNPTNNLFGRKFAIVSFRYLSDSEVLL